MNKRLKAHEDRRKDLLKSAEAILDGIHNRDLDDDESAKLDSIKREVIFTDGEIEREREASGYNRPICPDGIETGGLRMGGFGGGEKPSVKGRIGAKFSELFPQRSAINDIDAGEFFGALQSGTFHPGLNALNEGSGASGGYVVPDEVARNYFSVAYENSIVWPRATVFPMQGQTLRIPGFDASTAADRTLFGGMTWSWIPEEGTGTASNPTFRKCELTAHKLGLFATASNELAEDGLNLQTQLERAMQEGSGWALDYSFINGTGAGEPLGLLNDPAKIATTAEVAQDGGSIVYENVIGMFARLHPACIPNSIWICSSTAIPELLMMSHPIGISGMPVPVLKESTGTWSLLTRPVVFTEKCPVLGTEGDIVLCDLTQYAIGLRRELTVERSQHVNFMSDLTTWRGIMRVDGQGLWNSAYQPVHGGNTQSWLVTLATRP